jgi:hypothetical protein
MFMCDSCPEVVQLREHKSGAAAAPMTTAALAQMTPLEVRPRCCESASLCVLGASGLVLVQRLALTASLCAHAQVGHVARLPASRREPQPARRRLNIKVRLTMAPPAAAEQEVFTTRGRSPMVYYTHTAPPAAAAPAAAQGPAMEQAERRHVEGDQGEGGGKAVGGCMPLRWRCGKKEPGATPAAKHALKQRLLRLLGMQRRRVHPHA